MKDEICTICSAEGTMSKWATGLKDMRYSANKNKWDYLRCSNCGIICQKGLKIDSDVTDYYPISYETHKRNTFNNNQLNFIRRTLRKLSVVAFGYSGNTFLNVLLATQYRLLGSYVGWLKYTENLIDIGCGAGYYLEKMKILGCNVTGYDFDKFAVEACKSDGLNVRLGGVEEALIDSIDNSSVVLHHVLEHLTDPINDVRRLYENLSIGCELILITPNTSSVLFKEYESLHWHMDAPRHTFLFDMESARSSLRKLRIGNYKLFTSNRSFWGCWNNSFRYKYGTEPSVIDKCKALILFMRSLKNGNGDELIIKIRK